MTKDEMKDKINMALKDPLFQQHPPRKIYVFTNRINCALNGNAAYFKKSSAVCYAWFVWEKGSQQKPVIDWI